MDRKSSKENFTESQIAKSNSSVKNKVYRKSNSNEQLLSKRQNGQKVKVQKENTEQVLTDDRKPSKVDRKSSSNRCNEQLISKKTKRTESLVAKSSSSVKKQSGQKVK